MERPFTAWPIWRGIRLAYNYKQASPGSLIWQPCGDEHHVKLNPVRLENQIDLASPRHTAVPKLKISYLNSNIPGI